MKSDLGDMEPQGRTTLVEPPYKRWFEQEAGKVKHLERVLELLVVCKFVTREKLDDAKRLMA